MHYFVALILVVFSLFQPTALLLGSGSTPRLNLITPRGVQRGHEHVLRFSGERLSNAQQVFLYDAGVEILGLKQIDANNIDVNIKVDTDCRLGEHVAQVRTARGISDFRSFYVGAMSETMEVEPNNSLDQAQAIEWNVTANGTIANEDVDLYKITASKGRRLSVEIEAMRLGFWFDPFIAVLNDQKFEIAVSDDSVLHRQDGVISLTIPEDGDYYVLVREASYGGNGGCRYRLHVGDFPRPSVALPAAGTAGEEISVKFLGDTAGVIEQSISVPASSEFRSGLIVQDETGITPSPVAFRVSDLENQFEVEPNDNRKHVEIVHPLPNSFHGIISQAGDNDHFKFAANKGEAFDIDCYARRIRSGLDPVINIFNAAGQHIVGDDDARRPDCYLRFNVPETGEYFVRVRDHLKRGQDDFVYLIELKRVKPTLSISIPRVDRYSQLRQQICVPQGNRYATMISAARANFGGELKLIAENLPEGITMVSRPMVANLNLMPVVFEAAEEAELSGALVGLQGAHVDPEKNIVGDFSLIADFSLGQPNNARYYACTVDKVACAVTKKLPFKIELVQPQVPLVRAGSMNLKIIVERDEGFDAPMIVQFPFRPPGLGTKPQVAIEKGQTEVYYPINANGNAQIGKWPIYAIARANVDGPAWASSQLAELEIAEPCVSFEVNRSSCQQGESTSIYCKLNHRQAFEGEAIAEILGIPPNIEIPKLTFTKETQELTFEVKTNEKSPIGKHKGLFCRVTITENGEPIVSTAGRSELQINKPNPATKPAVAADSKPKVDSKPVVPAKPKSRLQKLRDAAKKQRG